MKRPEYVAAATAAFREKLSGGAPDLSELAAVFSRSGFTCGYLIGERDARMFGVRTKEDVAASAGSLKKMAAIYRTERKSVPLSMRLALSGAQTQLTVLRNQLDATLSTLSTSNASIDGNAAAMEWQIKQIDNGLQNSRIFSPIDGTVLVKYVEQGEMAAAGRPIMKVADLDNMYLRAYFTSDQLSKVKIGQKVTVIADFGGDEQYEYEGTVSWISAESEFTPKSIQTRNSRANLVYATKIAVKNDGRLKIGLYGEVKL